MSNFLDNLIFGAARKILNHAVELPARLGLNFAAPLVATDNSGSNRVDVSLDLTSVPMGPATTVESEVPTYTGAGPTLTRGPLLHVDVGGGNAQILPRGGTGKSISIGGVKGDVCLDPGPTTSSACTILNRADREAFSSLRGGRRTVVIGQAGTEPSGGAVTDHVQVYSSAGGILSAFGGYDASPVDVVGHKPGTVTSDTLVCFDGTSGALLKAVGSSVTLPQLKMPDTGPYASQGTIRLAQGASAWARNQANDGDVRIFSQDLDVTHFGVSWSPGVEIHGGSLTLGDAGNDVIIQGTVSVPSGGSWTHGRPFSLNPSGGTLPSVGDIRGESSFSIYAYVNAADAAVVSFDDGTMVLGDANIDAIRLVSASYEMPILGAFKPDTIAFANLKAWWRADTGVTSDADGVSSWANAGSLGGNLVQATNAKKPHTGYQIRGQQALHFDGGDELVSDLAASSWNFLHDGTGCTIVIVARKYSTLSSAGSKWWIDTGCVGGTTRGISIYHSGTNNVLHVGNGSTNVVNAALGKANHGGFTCLVARLLTGGSPAARLWYDSGHENNAAFDNAASASNATATLNVGASTGLVGAITGDLCELIAWNAVLTDSQLDLLEQYLNERYRYSPDIGA